MSVEAMEYIATVMNIHPPDLCNIVRHGDLAVVQWWVEKFGAEELARYPLFYACKNPNILCYLYSQYPKTHSFDSIIIIDSKVDDNRDDDDKFIVLVKGVELEKRNQSRLGSAVSGWNDTAFSLAKMGCSVECIEFLHKVNVVHVTPETIDFARRVIDEPLVSMFGFTFMHSNKEEYTPITHLPPIQLFPLELLQFLAENTPRELWVKNGYATQLLFKYCKANNSKETTIRQVQYLHSMFPDQCDFNMLPEGLVKFPDNIVAFMEYKSPGISKRKRWKALF